MINSITIGSDFISRLPSKEVPESTEGYEGFFHLHQIEGKVEQTNLDFIIRDHDRVLFDERKQLMLDLVKQMNSELGINAIEIDIKDQYFNMKEKVVPVMHIVDIAEEVMKDIGITPLIKPIRGGTDGSQLSFMGLPCPNIFAGGHNFHGRYEYVPVESMMKATEVIIGISEKVGRKFKD